MIYFNHGLVNKPQHLGSLIMLANKLPYVLTKCVNPATEKLGCTVALPTAEFKYYPDILKLAKYILE